MDMDIFERLKKIEHSPDRWAYEEEFQENRLRLRPIEELSFAVDQTLSQLSPNPFHYRRRAYLGESAYPRKAKQLFDPPWSLSFEGANIDIDSMPWLAVVGSREPRNETIEWLDIHLGQFLRKINCGIISGGARGVDIISHRIALREKRPTMVVLPSGLSQIYPSALAQEKKILIERGAVFVSEYSDYQVMRKYLFSHRNRLIAALSTVTLVVQAAERSGTIMTAHRALELGRPTWVLPGHPMDQFYRGSLDLLREGATLITSAQDLITFFESELNLKIFEGQP